MDVQRTTMSLGPAPRLFVLALIMPYMGSGVVVLGGHQRFGGAPSTDGHLGQDRIPTQSIVTPMEVNSVSPVGFLGFFQPASGIHAGDIEQWPRKWVTYKSVVWPYIFGAVLEIVIIFIFAYVYNLYRYTVNFEQEETPNSRAGFRYGFFNCFEDPQISLLACCCPALRWADTIEKGAVQPYEKGPVLPYWAGVAIYVALFYLSPLSGGGIYLAFVAMMTFFRRQLRKWYNIETGGLWTIFTDCCAWCWCGCCAIVQEARQVEAARRQPNQSTPIIAGRRSDSQGSIA